MACSRYNVLLAAAIGLSATHDARADGPLAWQWPADGRRFHIVTRTQLPGAIRWMAEQNLEVRVSEIQTDLVVSCVPSKVGKSALEIDCKFEDVSLQGKPLAADTSVDIGRIAKELDARLTAAFAQVKIGANGQVKDVDLEGFDKHDPRQSAIHDTMAMILARAFGALDFELPTKGEVESHGWRTSSLLVTTLPSNQGTMGSVPVTNMLTRVEGSPNIEIRSRGSGTLASSERTSYGDPLTTWNLTYEGQAVFDTDRGVLVHREYLVHGEVTASSAQVQPFVQTGRLDLLDAGTRPAVPESGRLQ